MKITHIVIGLMLILIFAGCLDDESVVITGTVVEKAWCYKYASFELDSGIVVHTDFFDDNDYYFKLEVGETYDFTIEPDSRDIIAVTKCE